MTIGLQTLTALVVVHFETTLFLEVTHGNMCTVLYKEPYIKSKDRLNVKRFLKLLYGTMKWLFALGCFTLQGFFDHDFGDIFRAWCVVRELH